MCSISQIHMHLLYGDSWSTCSVPSGILRNKFGTQRCVCCFRQSQFRRRAVSWKWVWVSGIWRVVLLRVLHLAKDQEEWIAPFRGKMGKLHAAKPVFIRRDWGGASFGGDSRSWSPWKNVKPLLEKRNPEECPSIPCRNLKENAAPFCRQ